MRRIEAQLKPRWRPGPAALAALVGLAACVVVSLAGLAWAHHRVSTLRAQIAQLAEDARNGARPLAPRPVALYDASARQFLRERAAGWAAMLRTLENGAMIGVTPSSVDFDVADSVARAELNYSDSTALFDYLGRINEGVSPAHGVARWTLVETRQRSSSASPPNIALGGADARFTASIRSAWPDAAADVAGAIR